MRVQVVILSTRLITDDWIGVDLSSSSEPIRGEGGDLEYCTKSVNCLYLILPNGSTLIADFVKNWPGDSTIDLRKQ